MAEYAALLLNRFEVGHDGRTAYERNKGTRANMFGVEFAEAVLWKKKAAGGEKAKLETTWAEGCFSGIKGVSGEFINGTEEGVKKTRTMKWRPEEER